MHNRGNQILQAGKLVISALLIAGLIVTQAFPLSDALLTAKPESKGKAQAIVAPANPVSAQIKAQEPVKDPKSMAPLPFCQQSAILSIQAVVNTHSFDTEKAICGLLTYTISRTSETHVVRSLPHSRALVHTQLALQATLVGAYPSGTS